MLVDSFLYNGERDIFELRYETLRDVVDLFICIQSAETFTGKPRDTEWLGNLPKVMDVVTGKMPFASPKNAWKREAFQRNELMRLMPQGIEPTDLIMVSDVDEIPNPDLLSKSDVLSAVGDKVMVFEQDWYQFNFHNFVKDTWRGTRMCSMSTLSEHWPQGVRNMHHLAITNGGWHLSWFHDPENKLVSYSHVELQEMEGTIQQRVEAKWPRERVWIANPNPESLPPPILLSDQWNKYIT